MPQLKYEQIADSLRRRITEGEFGPGDLLPSSRDLCEQWQVSRATAVKAMEVLRTDGLVVPHQGRGFVVTEVPIARPAGGRAAGNPRVRGGAPFRRMGEPNMRPAPRHVAEALGLAPGAEALRRARLMLLDGGSAHSYVTAWFPPDVAERCPRLAQSGPIAEGTTHYVTRTTGRAPARGVDTATVRLASQEEAEHLQVERPCPVVVVLHVAYDQDGRPLVCEEGVVPGELWEHIDEYPMGGLT